MIDINIYDILQLIGGLVLAVGYVPQLIQIAQTKSVEDLNLNTFLSIFIGIGLMEIYSFNLVKHGSGTAFLITNSLSLFIAGLMCVLILKYKNKNYENYRN